MAAVVNLTRLGGLIVLQSPVVFRPMPLALVDEGRAGEAPRTPVEIDEAGERELMGREEVAPPVAHEHPVRGEISSDGRMMRGATSASELVGERTNMKHDHKSNQAHRSSNATTAS